MARWVSVTRGRVHEEAVQSYIRVGGEVNDLLNAVAQDANIYNKRYVSNGHVRSGRLLGGLTWNRAKLTGPLQGNARIISAANHTDYFNEGTASNGTGMIMHPNMIVPRNRNAKHTNTRFKGAGAEQLAVWKGRSERQQKRGKGVYFMNAVRGQRAKPFMREGLTYSLAKHGLK